jgi:hypothetical protein
MDQKSGQAPQDHYPNDLITACSLHVVLAGDREITGTIGWMERASKRMIFKSVYRGTYPLGQREVTECVLRWVADRVDNAYHSGPPW